MESLQKPAGCPEQFRAWRRCDNRKKGNSVSHGGDGARPAGEGTEDLRLARQCSIRSKHWRSNGVSNAVPVQSTSSPGTNWRLASPPHHISTPRDPGHGVAINCNSPRIADNKASLSSSKL